MSLIPGLDVSRVNWKQTFQLHLIRSVCAGLVWAVVLLLVAGVSAPWWAAPVMMPVAYFVAAPFYMAIAKAAALFGPGGQAFGGFITLVLAVGIVMGDPLVYLVSKQRPDLVPVDRVRLFNFVIVLFVTEPPAPVFDQV